MTVDADRVSGSHGSTDARPTNAALADRPATEASADGRAADVPDAPAPDEKGAAVSGEFEVAEALPRALKIVGTIVAPTTLLTGLLYYFGLLYAVGYYRYFGVNFTVLELPVQGFLILSASTAILPLLVIVLGMLLALWIYQWPLDRLSGGPRRFVLRGVMPALALAGVVLLGLAAADVLLGARPFPPTFWEARGLSVVLGVLLLSYAARLRSVLAAPASQGPRHGAPPALTVAKWGGVFILVSVGLFWAVGSYAIRVGTDGARGLAADLRCAPEVILYSQQSLNLASAGLREEPSSSAESAYGFRYPGLRLVPQAGNHYLLLPADWSPSARPAILLPRAETLRLEFVSGPPAGAC